MRILGTGSGIPAPVLKNEELEKSVNTSAKWIEETLGIKERRILAPGHKTSDMATWAGFEAIEDADISLDDIDLCIVATATPDKLTPSTACLVQDRLGIYNAVCFDVNAGGAGFIYALSIAEVYLANGIYDNALIIGVDSFSRIADWDSRDSVFFGDGAGAAVVTYGGRCEFTLVSDGRGKKGFEANHGEKLNINGRAVFGKAVDALPKVIAEVLNWSGMTIDDIDLMIPHQPSMGVLKEVAKRIGLPWEKVRTNIDRYAYTAAGSIPILLDEVNKEGNLIGNILLIALGSGFTWGAAILEL